MLSELEALPGFIRLMAFLNSWNDGGRAIHSLAVHCSVFLKSSSGVWEWLFRRRWKCFLQRCMISTMVRVWPSEVLKALVEDVVGLKITLVPASKWHMSPWSAYPWSLAAFRCSGSLWGIFGTSAFWSISYCFSSGGFQKQHVLLFSCLSDIWSLCCLQWNSLCSGTLNNWPCLQLMLSHHTVFQSFGEEFLFWLSFRCW